MTGFKKRRGGRRDLNPEFLISRILILTFMTHSYNDVFENLISGGIAWINLKFNQTKKLYIMDMA